VFEEIFATPLGLDLSQVARLYGLVYSPVSDRSGLEPAIADAIAAPTPTMVVVRFKREDSVNGHRLCWEAAASALKS
jgi:2-succinyl-5-enolpyruvyl-6-hydroxy-3-cyclohexene-1-carboxylate synthase